MELRLQEIMRAHLAHSTTELMLRVYLTVCHVLVDCIVRDMVTPSLLDLVLLAGTVPHQLRKLMILLMEGSVLLATTAP